MLRTTCILQTEEKPPTILEAKGQKWWCKSAANDKRLYMTKVD